MTRHSKIGIVAAAAIVLGLAAFGLGKGPDISAQAVSLTAAPACTTAQNTAAAPTILAACAPVGSLITVTGAWVDDTVALPSTSTDGSATFTATGTLTSANPTGLQVGVFTNLVLTLSDQCVVIGLCGVGTDTVIVPADTDTVSETITATLTFLCDINGIEQIVLAQGVGAPSITIFVQCGSPFVAAGIPASFLTKVVIGGTTIDCGPGVSGFTPPVGGISGGFSGENSTICVSNRVNVESVPAPGSDNDARIDVKVFDSSGVAVAGAHVHFIVTQGSITVGNGSTTGLDASVVEPDAFGTLLASTTNLGSIITGDTCENAAGFTPGGLAAPDPFSPQTADAFSDGFGEVSACYFASFPGFATAAAGPVVVTILVDRNPAAIAVVEALTGTVTITVVGPPFAITVAGTPTSVTCGQRITVTATVKDSFGQNVSDHSRVDFVTNFGGVLGGSGLSLGSFLIGPVSPLSSTSVETFGGIATAQLITSEETTGPYEIVATSGGTGLGGIFSTAPVNGFLTVSCALPAPPPAATIAAPRTGTGISPPNTGDAGLLGSSSSTSWTLFAIGGAFALTLAGLATFKFARR